MDYFICECGRLSWRTRLAAALVGTLVGMSLVTAVGLMVSAFA